MKKLFVLAFLLLASLAFGQEVTTSSVPSVPVTPGGRLTVTTGVPVITSSVVSQTTLYYAAYVHRFVPIYDGVGTNTYSVCAANTAGACQLSIVLGANWAANSAHDVFVTLSGGTPVLCTVAWSTLTTRATALQQFNGLQTNSSSATCRTSNAATITLAANQGTYLGSFYTNVSRAGEIDYHLGGSASGGVPASLGVCNYYNRVQTTAVVTDSGSTYTYTLSVVRPARNGSTSQIRFMHCLQEDSIVASMYGSVQSAAAVAAQGAFGIGADASNAYGVRSYCESVAAVADICSNTAAGVFSFAPGQRTIYSVESSDGTNAMTFNLSSVNALMISVRN